MSLNPLLHLVRFGSKVSGQANINVSKSFPHDETPDTATAYAVGNRHWLQMALEQRLAADRE